MRLFIEVASLAVFTAAASDEAVPAPEKAAPSKEKPNIILVLVDDMGWGDLSLNQQDGNIPRIQTPNIARLAREGMQLRRHYTSAPVCAPARASLFTGVHQGHAEVIRNNSFDAALEDSHTLASVLRAAGYSTALIGKWGLGGGMEGGGTPSTSPAWPTKRGFDYFFGYNNHIAGHRHYPKEESNSDPETHCNAIWDGETILTPLLDGCYSTDLFTARAKKWITDQQRETPHKPFFLALTLTAPHARLAVPAVPYPAGGGLQGGVQWLGEPGRMINTASPQTWDAFIHPDYREAWKDYAGQRYPGKGQQKVAAARRHATMITRVDDAVGDIARLCQDLGIDHNTLIIFTSDNGPHAEPGAVTPIAGHPAPAQDPSFFHSYGNLDGIKRDVWDGGLRVPCVVWMPGTVAAGAVSNRPGQFQDWMATFADMAGIPQPMRCDGVSLLPTLMGKPDQQKDGVVYSEYAFGRAMDSFAGFAPNKKGRKRGEQQVIFFQDEGGKWLKAIRTDIQTGEEDFEIYDTLADSHEATDLSQQYTSMQDKLRAEVLYQRRAYDYTRSPAAGARRNPCGGRRPYDSLAVPANPLKEMSPGLQMRRIKADCPWVPEWDTLPGAAAATATVVANPSSVSLPAGSVTEFKGYIRIPDTRPDWHFYLTLDKVPGSKAYIRMHRFQLIDADASYTPGGTATESAAANVVEADEEKTGKAGIPLEAGWHEIQIVVVQGPASPGYIKLKWDCGSLDKDASAALGKQKKGQVNRNKPDRETGGKPIPSHAFGHVGKS